MRADVEPSQPDVEQEPGHGHVDVERHPGRYLHGHPGRPQGHVADREHHSHQPGEGDGRIVQHQGGVVQAVSPRQLPQPAYRLGDHDLVGTTSPPQLLTEEVGPGSRPLANRYNVRRVHRLPVPSGGRLMLSVYSKRGGQILGDRILEPADLSPCRHPIGVVRADEHPAVEPVRGPLDDRVEHVVLRFRAPGQEAVEVPVDLRPHDKGDIGVAKVAEHARGEVRQRNVVGVDRQHDVIGGAVGVQPGVVVAMLRLGPEPPFRLVPPFDPFAAEMVDPEVLAHLADRRVVPLVEQPDVDGCAVTDLPGRDQGVAYDVQRLLRRDDGGRERDPQACRRPDRHRVAHDVGGPAKSDRIK